MRDIRATKSEHEREREREESRGEREIVKAHSTSSQQCEKKMGQPNYKHGP